MADETPLFLHRRRRRRASTEPGDALSSGIHRGRLQEAASGHRIDLEHGGRRATWHINELAEEAVRGADDAGAKAVQFNTITISDGISMGTPGMRYSLVSREVIADSIETVVGAQGFDGFVAIGGCDKNMPACGMAIARIDRPAVFRLRRNHPPRRRAPRHCLGVRGRRRSRRGDGLRHRAQRGPNRPPSPVPARAPACTPPTRWRRPSKRLACPLPNSSAQNAVSDAKRQDSYNARRSRAQPHQARHQAQRHLVPRSVRERDHRRDRARRIDQRRAPLARHRSGRRHPARAR